jgi:hypothetical protein
MQRYMDAGLNPHLIYGSAANSPSAMVRNTTQGAARAESSGYIEALGIKSRGIQGAMQMAQNNYFANKQLENDTNLKNAQILNLKSQSDKTELSNAITEKSFDQLVKKIELENSLIYQKYVGQTAENTNRPTDEQVSKRYDAETARTLELLEMAKKENKLKQSDIETMERLSGTRGGDKMIFELLKMILQGGINKYSK